MHALLNSFILNKVQSLTYYSPLNLTPLVLVRGDFLPSDYHCYRIFVLKTKQPISIYTFYMLLYYICKFNL